MTWQDNLPVTRNEPGLIWPVICILNMLQQGGEWVIYSISHLAIICGLSLSILSEILTIDFPRVRSKQKESE